MQDCNGTLQSIRIVYQEHLATSGCRYLDLDSHCQLGCEKATRTLCSKILEVTVTRYPVLLSIYLAYIAFVLFMIVSAFVANVWETQLIEDETVAPFVLAFWAFLTATPIVFYRGVVTLMYLPREIELPGETYRVFVNDKYTLRLALCLTCSSIAMTILFLWMAI